jgi:SAM-dependent methyltransferase
MQLDALAELRTPGGQAALAAAHALGVTPETELRALTVLRQTFSPALARAALETVVLRERARAKFSRADQMLFERQALEQASGEVIARYRARRFGACRHVADLGCGLGGDAIGLAEVSEVTLIDRDPVRLALADHNLSVYGRRPRATLAADLLEVPPPPADGLWFDPARRGQGRRLFHVDDYVPPLNRVHEWARRTPAIGVKISPGVDLSELQPYLAEREFISEGGELKECVLWFGPLATARRRATVLPGGHSLTAGDEATLPAGVRTPGRYLYEPDPAVLRAGLVRELGAQLSAEQIDAEIAFLTSDRAMATPFATVFAIEDVLAFQLKRLRAHLRTRGIGRVTVKKRGSPIAPEDLMRQLRLNGEGLERTLILTQIAGAPSVLIVQRC